MRLLPREIESLLIHEAGFLAQKRLARGVRLNYPEAVALISCQIQELVRDGITLTDAMSKGKDMLGWRQVMNGVASMISTVEVEATFPDGTKLITVHNPIVKEHGDLTLALYGSFLPVPDTSIFKDEEEEGCFDGKVLKPEIQEILDCPPGYMFIEEKEPIEINKGRKTKLLNVVSVCDRPIQVGSHYSFIETNKYLVFDRAESYGMRLNIPSGYAIRFEPGESLNVPLVEIGGRQIVHGGNGLCSGPINSKQLPAIMEKVEKLGFGNKKQKDILPAPKCLMDRLQYARTFGPTVKDKVKLGDSSLVIEVEKDFTVYGDECKFGGGKVLREGMGQAAMRSCNEVLDTLITNALIVDAVSGIIKADVGIKNGKIVGIGKAGNPDIMNGVHSNMVFGAGTEAISGEGLILTAGGVDCHIHFICPQLIKEAITVGITTMVGGGTGPADGTRATTCTPGSNHIKYMIQSTDEFPMNIGFTGKGNSSCPNGIPLDLEEQIEAGAIGLKLHEDWGTTPSAIDSCLKVADKHDVQVTIHTDSLNEACCVEDTIKALKGRPIHTYHTEGAGGGHAPDIIKICSELNVLPSSTSPTKPYTVNTVDEQLDMLMVCHNLDRNLKQDVAFADSRIRAETMQAEDILHDTGAISMMSSDSQAMGRVGEVISRTWQTADKMKQSFGHLKEDNEKNDNYRVKRYIAKYTINPAICHGISHVVGSIEVGKCADLVIWDPVFFGTKPDIVIKGGQIAYSKMGLANAAIPTPQPVKQRKMFGAYGKSPSKNSCIFVSKISLEQGVIQTYGIHKQIVPVSRCRTVTKKDMILNNSVPQLKVDPYLFKVYQKKETVETDKSDIWEHLSCLPADRVSLSQRYYFF